VGIGLARATPYEKRRLGTASLPRIVGPVRAHLSRVPLGGARASGRHLGAVGALGLLEHASLERPAARLPGQADPRARVVGLDLEPPELALGDRRRAVAVVLLLGQEVPAEDGELARGGAGGHLGAAAGLDPPVKARSGPGVRMAAWAASTSSPRAWAWPAREMWPWRAGRVPDWRTRGSRPR
jgi:hypothetical protein